MERRVAALALDLGALTRKMARLRDKGDNMVKTLQDFASSESGTVRKSLEGLGECLSALENSQQLQVCGLDTGEYPLIRAPSMQERVSSLISGVSSFKGVKLHIIWYLRIPIVSCSSKVILQGVLLRGVLYELLKR